MSLRDLVNGDTCLLMCVCVCRYVVNTSRVKPSQALHARPGLLGPSPCIPLLWRSPPPLDSSPLRRVSDHMLTLPRLSPRLMLLHQLKQTILLRLDVP